MDRRALLVGINEYQRFSHLRCARDDASLLAKLLERNDDESLNYAVRCVTDEAETITRARLRQLCLELFDGFDGDLLFFFAGHGAQTPWGGVLVAQDATEDEPGLAMEDILVLANRSPSREVVVILDCCHSGDLGNPPILQGLGQDLALLREGVTILAASRPNEPAYEVEGHGAFTYAIAEGLAGGAADLLGNVSAASLFLYADRFFDAWDQRPIYKSHSSCISALRSCRPPVDLAVLKAMRRHFAAADGELRLDPEHESDPQSKGDSPERQRKRRDAENLKRLRDARLLESVDGDDLYWTAMNSKGVRLTALGRYYWRLLEAGKL